MSSDGAGARLSASSLALAALMRPRTPARSCPSAVIATGSSFVSGASGPAKPCTPIEPTAPLAVASALPFAGPGAVPAQLRESGGLSSARWTLPTASRADPRQSLHSGLVQAPKKRGQGLLVVTRRFAVRLRREALLLVERLKRRMRDPAAVMPSASCPVCAGRRAAETAPKKRWRHGRRAQG